MKKKSIIALILAASLSLGVAAAAGCNTVDPNGPGNQTENEGGSTAVTGVTLSDSAITLTLNQNGSKKLTATVSPSNATDKGVVWTSDNKAVATVDQNGNVTAVSRGTAVITVTTSNGLYADTCTVTVNESQSGGDTVSVTGVSLDNNTATMTAGGTKTLTATITPSTANNKNLTWSSDKPNIATVDQNGKVTAVAKGTAIITVTTEDGGHKATCTVTVEGTTQNTPVSSISIGSATATLDLNGQKTKQFSATVLPATATVKTVTWKSSNTSVVTVDQNGLATAKATGTATIPATADDGSGVKSSCSVTVTDSTVVSKTKYTVDFYSDGVKVSSQEVEEGKCATIPSDVKKDGYYISGWGTSSATGANYDFTAKVTGNLALHAKWEKVAAGLAYSYAGNECAAFEWGESNHAGATVKYKLSGGSYENVDSQLIRSSTTAGNARVDIVGLKGGATYDFEITTSANKTINVSNMQISAYDRSGYAHFNYTSGVGGYNDDGTPKSNAAIVYFTESNKNDTVTVHGKSCTGIVGVLTTKFSKPVIIRVIGTVGAATWNKIDYNESGKWSSKNKMPKSEVKGING
ncbi:MAG: Ig-like domain-containing protein, partial [Clostridia bacterium]|nr:Ig-like domain-containing protein [Clostridia bacterium]